MGPAGRLGAAAVRRAAAAGRARPRGRLVTRVVIVSGVTGVDDPWHDFRATSQAVADVLSDNGWTCTVVTTVETTSALQQADLLIVNSGLHSPPGPDGLLDYLASPRPVLGLHTAANTFADVPQWTQRLGVR